MEYGLVLLWLATFLWLLAAGTPLAAAVFGRFADRGAGLALPLSLSVLGVVGYWVGQVAFGWPALVAGLVVLLVGSLAVTYRGVDPDWGSSFRVGVVFAVGFLFVVGVRAVDPAVQPPGGEKFLDLGMLSSLARTEVLPPEDFWMAGEPVQYYYGGHLVASLLAKLTFTSPPYAYNLALAGFFGALVSSVYGLAGNLAAVRGRSYAVTGALGAFLVGVASNLATPLRALGPLGAATADAVVDVAPPLLDDALGAAFGLFPAAFFRTAHRNLLSVTGVATSDGTVADGFGQFYYWDASRVIDGTLINEFPLFAYLNGDLHAHMMVSPFLLLVAGLLFAYWQTPAADVRRRRLLVFGAIPPLAGFLALVNTWSFPTVIGLTWLTTVLAPSDPSDLLPPFWNSLDAGEDWSLAAEADRILTGTVVAVVVAVAGAILGFEIFTGPASGRGVGLFPDRSPLNHLLVVHGTFVVATAAFLYRRSDRTASTARWLVATGFGVVGALGLLGLDAALYGALAGFAVLWFVDDAWLGEITVLLLAGALWVLDKPLLGLFAAVLGASWVLTRDARVVVGGFLALAFAWLLGVVPVVLFGGLLAGGWYLVRTDRAGFETVLALGAIGIVVLVEFAYVKEPAAPGRFNTLFKLYADVWVLWATAAAVMLAEVTGLRATVADVGTWLDDRLASDERRSTDGVRDAGPEHPVANGAGGGGGRNRYAAVALVVLLALLSVYAGLALGNHLDDPPERTLDARQYDHPRMAMFAGEGRVARQEAPAIEWLADREGQPDLVTVPGAGPTHDDALSCSIDRLSSYHWVNAPSALTGLPTVAGWTHAADNQGDEKYERRVAHVAAIFTGTPRRRAELLRRYDVEYVYVGPGERSCFGGTNDLYFADEPGITVAKQFEHVTVYAVDQDQLLTNSS